MREGYFDLRLETNIFPIWAAAALMRTFYGFCCSTIWHKPTQDTGLTNDIEIFSSEASSGQIITSFSELVIWVACVPLLLLAVTDTFFPINLGSFAFSTIPDP